MLKHVVLFKFKPNITAAQRKEFVVALRALPKTITDIKGWQVVETIPNRPARFSHVALFSEFDDVAGLDRYIAHPDHRTFVTMVEAFCESRANFDYE
jgi:quinol monooxygenase YgiN